jgi:hypothetical protein
MCLDHRQSFGEENLADVTSDVVNVGRWKETNFEVACSSNNTKAWKQLRLEGCNVGLCVSPCFKLYDAK